MQENTSTLTELLQTHTSKEMTSASTKMVLSLHTLPIHLVYRILDNLDNFTILVSCRGVCTRLNDITDTYKRYQVIFHFIMRVHIPIIFETCCTFQQNILF